MKKLLVCLVAIAATGTAQAYTIKFSYSGQNNSTEYFGACDRGGQLKVVQYHDGRFAFEGPAGKGEIRGEYGLDKAAAAACGE